MGTQSLTRVLICACLYNSVCDVAMYVYESIWIYPGVLYTGLPISLLFTRHSPSICLSIYICIFINLSISMCVSPFYVYM